MGFELNSNENCHNMDNQKVSQMCQFTFKLSQLHNFRKRKRERCKGQTVTKLLQHNCDYFETKEIIGVLYLTNLVSIEKLAAELFQRLKVSQVRLNQSGYRKAFVCLDH